MGGDSSTFKTVNNDWKMKGHIVRSSPLLGAAFEARVKQLLLLEIGAGWERIKLGIAVAFCAAVGEKRRLMSRKLSKCSY